MPWMEDALGGGAAKKGKGRPRKFAESSVLLDTTNHDEDAGGEPILISSIGGGNTMRIDRALAARRKEAEAAEKVAKDVAVNAEAVSRGYWELPNPNGETPTIVMTRVRKRPLMADGTAAGAGPIKGTRAKKVPARVNPHAASEAALLARSATGSKKRKAGDPEAEPPRKR